MRYTKNESRVRRDYSVKTRYILVVVGTFLSANFAFAQGMLTQSGSGGGGTDATSANFSMKAAVADPGVGQSQSANYIYDHGTLWVAGVSTSTLPPVEVPIGGSGGGGSGSGWDEWWDIDDPDLGISSLPPPPEKNPVVEEVVRVVQEVSSPEMGAIPAENFKEKTVSWIVEKCTKGCVLVAVNPDNSIREVAVTLVKRVLPWPFWIAIALMVFGIAGIALFMMGALAGHRAVWGAGALIMIGLGAGIWMRAHYRAAFRQMDFTSIVDARVVSPDEADKAVGEIADELPVGGHTITVASGKDTPQMTITVYVKKALPI